MKRTIEQITAEAILQEPRMVEVNGKEYRVAPPSVATLIEASKYISQLPDLSEIAEPDDENAVLGTIGVAKDCEYLGRIAAIMMLGKKRPAKKERLFGKETDSLDELSEALLLDLSPRELHDLIVELFRMQDVGFFLSALIFLKRIKMIHATKTTASGR
jgi:hypothetical protein